MQTARTLAGDLFGVVLHGLRLVVAHWPVLAVIYLLGAAGRNGVLWAAVSLSENHPTVAWFLLPLAPMFALGAFILMLYTVAGSLPTAGVDLTGPRSRLRLLASALIPFLTVYAAQGYLKEDRDIFINHTVYDAIFGSSDPFYGGSSHASERLAIGHGWALVAIVVVAFTLRFLVSRFDLPSRSATVAPLAGYLEVLWMLVLAGQFTIYQDKVWDWILERRFVHFVTGTWDALIAALGVIGHPLQVAVGALGSFIDHADTTVLIPLAWLTVGAVALGGTLPERETKEGRLQRYTRRVPGKVKTLGNDLTKSLTDRFRGLADGLRILALGGLAPMLMFCLAFILARETSDLVGELWRLVVGPQEHNTGLAFAGWRETLAGGASTVVLVGLLGAAIERILSRRPDRDQPRLTSDSLIST